MKQFFNLVVPMAGRGSRFTDQGYTDSKPFIDVEGKPMIQRVIENLNFEFNPEFKTIILCQKSDYERYDFSIFREIIGHDNIKIIQVDGITEGAACTLLLAKEFIDSDVPMLSFNTDQMIDYKVEDTFSKFKKYDGGIPCFKGNGTDWSYAKEEKGVVVEVAEKKQISNDATAGYYYWSKGSDFVKYAEQMIAANDRVNNEFYVAPVYNYAIKDGKRICITHVDNIYELGTPEYLENYISSKKKIAVCFYGQTRFIEGYNNFYSKWNDKSHSFSYEFFKSSWADFEYSNINLEFKKCEYINFKSTYIPEDQGNTQKMAYLAHRVLKLKQEHEISNNFTYDLVIFLRSDILLNFKETESILLKLQNYTSDRPVVSCLDSIILDEKRNFKLGGDYAFIMSSDAADLHSGIYSFFYLHKKHLSTNFNYREGGHWIHSLYFKYFNYDILFNKIQACIVRPTIDSSILKSSINAPNLFSLLGENRKKWKSIDNDTVTDGEIQVELKGKIV